MRARAIVGVVTIALLSGAALPAKRTPAPAAIDRQRDRLEAAEAEAMRLLAAVQGAPRLPAIVALLRPGSIEDIVHIHAVLTGMQPQWRDRLAVLRGEIARGRALGVPATGAAAYRLPVAGDLVMGFGAVSEAGVRSRGLSFAVPPGAPVIAPAGGVVRYAQAFRGYGGTVIVDHGRGWTSVLTGLGTLAVRPGLRVRGGARIGTARRGGNRQVTLELRRRGEPVDAAALIRER